MCPGFAPVEAVIPHPRLENELGVQMGPRDLSLEDKKGDDSTTLSQGSRKSRNFGSSNATSTIYQLGDLREVPDTEQSRDSITAPLLPLSLVHSVERKHGQSLESPPALQRRQRE